MTVQQAARSQFEPGTLLGGKYRIVSLIGVGGAGRVYLARHIELETEVAVKALRPEMADRPEVVQRFAREARASVRLRSERIARVLDVGTHEGKPYFVMEYMVGCNLLEARQQADIDIATLCEFFIQACEGLADAHSQGVVHRDIKPENLFVARDASGWRSLKIFDFGISKFSLTGRYSDVDLASMRTEAMMGTPHYISPEQIRSTRDVDHRTDIWSLGAVMFEVLSGGILPFREEREVTALVAEVLERPHRSLLDVAPNVPERLAAIVDRCLAKDRNLRYQTVAEVALDLLPLAPARARASAERAVSVMQAAGLMALNGDMESLRPTQMAASERAPSQAPPSPSSESRPGPPASGRRPSDSFRAAPRLPTPSTLQGATAGQASAPPAVSGQTLAGFGTKAVLAGRPASENPAPTPAIDRNALTPDALMTPAPPVPSASLEIDIADDDFDRDASALTNKNRTRKAVTLGALLVAVVLGAIGLLSTKHQAPRAALPASTAPAALTKPMPSAEPPVVELAALPALPLSKAPIVTSSAERKAVPKVVWQVRPAVVPVAVKSSAPKPQDLPPPTPRPELRRER